MILKNSRILYAAFGNWWDENGKTRERIGETIFRLGMGKFLREAEIPAVPQQVFRPRANPYVFWNQDDLDKSGTAMDGTVLENYNK